MTNLDQERIRIDDPGYPNTDIPERRDLLDWLGWTLALVGLVILIVAIAVVVGYRAERAQLLAPVGQQSSAGRVPLADDQPVANMSAQPALACASHRARPEIHRET